MNGRKAVEWHDRIKLSVWYVEHLTVWLDIKIFFMTFIKVLSNADNENVGATVINDEKNHPAETEQAQEIVNK